MFAHSANFIAKYIMADDPFFLSFICNNPTLINHSNYITATDAHQDQFLFDSDPLPTTSSVESLAQELLQQIGWTYYTIWKEVEYPPFMSMMQLGNVPSTPPGLVWSKGDVNIDHLLTGADGSAEEQRRACKMGLALQQFYQQCSLLPLGTGIAGRAISSRKYQWVSGYELLQQVSTLSSFNNQPILPSELQAQDFQTIVCIPLEKGAGVLEIGTTIQVAESVELLSQILKFTNGPTTSHQLGQQAGPMISRPFDGAIWGYDDQKTAEDHTTVGYAKNEEHTPLGYASNAMQIYGSSRAAVLTRQQSLPSSHSSVTSSSSHQLEQLGKSTTVLTPSPAHNPFNSNEEVFMNPGSMLTSFSQLDLLNQLRGHTSGDYGGTISSTLPGLISNQIHDLCDVVPSNYPDQYDEHLLSDSPAFCSYLISSGALEGPSSPPLPSVTIPEYMPQQPSAHHPHHHHHMSHLALNSGMLVQPLQCAAGCNASRIHQPNEAEQSQADATTIPVHHNASVRNTGKQAETYNAQMYPSVVRKSSEMDQATTPLMAQGSSTSSVTNPTASLLVHQRINVNLAIASHRDPEAELMIKGFRPWNRSSMYSFKLKKKMNSSVTNRYNVKQIMRFHLPSWFTDMMHQEASARIAANFALNARQKVQRTAEAAELYSAVGKITDHETQDQNTSNVQNEAAAKQHMIAERKRRRKQGDCLAALRTLVPNITKRDKVTILERTIDYLKEMNSLISELRQQNKALGKENIQCPQNIAERSYMSQNDATLQSLAYSPNLSTRNATCEFHHSPSHSQGTLPHFELDMSVNQLEDNDVNASIIRVISALQQKELTCIDVKVDFQQELGIMYAKLRAHYKDETKNIPNHDDIEDIEQWWRRFVETM